MIKVIEKDIDKATEFIKNKTPLEIKSDFISKNRGKIYNTLHESIALQKILGANEELISISLMDIMYQIWKTYYVNKETVEDIFGEEQDYLDINDDIIELVTVNAMDKICCRNSDIELNYETLLKALEDASERIVEMLDENEDFMTLLFAKGVITFSGEPLLMGLLAFYSIEEAIKREKNV